ncbi:hypothetical protein Ms3S1_p20520 (plasmid) [Methylosinus sp. 3S-1]
MEVAQRDGAGGDIVETHADHGAADGEILGPAAAEQFGAHAERLEIERRPLRRGLLVALALGIIGEADRARALLDAGRQIGGGIADRAAEAGGLIAIGVIGEGRGDRPAGNAGDGVRARRAGGRIVVIADVGFGEEIADRRIGEALDDPKRLAVASKGTFRQSGAPSPHPTKQADQIGTGRGSAPERAN